MIRVAGPSLPYDPTYHLLGRLDKIRALIRRENPDVLEVHSPYLAMAAALAVRRAGSGRSRSQARDGAIGLRTFWWHADFIDTYLRVMLERHASSRAADIALAPLWAAVAGVAGRCDATFAAGKWQVAKLRDHGVPRVVHAPFGIDKKTFRPEARSEARRRALLERSGPGTRLLVGVGRFAVEKRWDVVLDAFLALRSGPGAIDAKLVLFGDGPEKSAMLARVAGRDDVRFLGFEKDREQLASALASADALVHGCPYETFGLGVAEAMSAGLPVVVPDEGGASESVVASCGEIYASRDAGACAEAIRRILARDPKELRLAALVAAASIADVTDHFEGLLDTYRDLLARRARG